jgi:hypothetical protein
MNPPIKTMICLAKSRKQGGFCFAGKEYNDGGPIGNWIRPTSSREKEEISSSECEYEDECFPELLDIIEVPYRRHNPNKYQPENYLIDHDYYWEKVGKFPFEQLEDICDYPQNLWRLGDSSFHGFNDQVAATHEDCFDCSLYLIKPRDINILVRMESQYLGGYRKKVRVRFKYNKKIYILSVTDPDIENFYTKQPENTYNLSASSDTIYMCVSTGTPYKGSCFKFAASIMMKR